MSIHLTGVEETLLIPLVAKARETRKKNGRIRDTRAVDIVSALGEDFSRFDGALTQGGVVARTVLFDRETKNFVAAHPDAVCVSLGCGLDARFERVDTGFIRWYDVDLPGVIALRRRFFQDGERRRMVAGSVLEDAWTREVEVGSRPLLIIIEGVLMYFTEDEVRTLLRIIRDAFPQSRVVTIVAELMHPRVVNNTKHHDTVKKTSAVFRWGVRDGREVEKLCPGLRCVEETNFFAEMKRYRPLFWVMAHLPFLRRMNNRMAVFTLRARGFREDKHGRATSAS